MSGVPSYSLTADRRLPTADCWQKQFEAQIVFVYFHKKQPIFLAVFLNDKSAWKMYNYFVYKSYKSKE